MRYLGGKARLRDQIVPIINSIDASIYLEPFCGACWVGEKVTIKHRIFSDANKYLIAMWQALQGGWEPPKTCCELDYQMIKEDISDMALHGFIAIASSYGGKWWGGYAREKMENGEWRDYTRNCYNQCMSRIENFKGVTFLTSGYSRVFKKVMLAKNPMVMYLDPPYEQTTTYAGLPPFDTQRFWQNVRTVSKKHYVITSGYEAPEDFRVVREFQPKTGMNLGRMEKIFAQGLVLEDYNFD